MGLARSAGRSADGLPGPGTTRLRACRRANPVAAVWAALSGKPFSSATPSLALCQLHSAARYQHHARNVVAIQTGADPHVIAAPRMADQHRGRRNARSLRQPMQLLGDHAAGARSRTRFAVTDSGPIVGASLGEFRDLRLHPAPAKVRVSQPRLENDHGGFPAPCS